MVLFIDIDVRLNSDSRDQQRCKWLRYITLTIHIHRQKTGVGASLSSERLRHSELEFRLGPSRHIGLQFLRETTNRRLEEFYSTGEKVARNDSHVTSFLIGLQILVRRSDSTWTINWYLWFGYVRTYTLIELADVTFSISDVKRFSFPDNQLSITLQVRFNLLATSLTWVRVEKVRCPRSKKVPRIENNRIRTI